MRILLLALMLLSLAPAQAEVRTARPGSSPPQAKIEDLVWLAGHWEGEGLGGRSIETISPPVGGQMAGHFQQLGADGALQFYEIYQFVPHEGSILLRLKHFNADLTGWEERGATVDFPLVAIEPGAAYFEGLTYRLVGQDRMESFVRVEGKDGQTSEAAFRYRRAELD